MAMTLSADRPVTVLICALGGEGGGVLSQWLFEAALHCGHSAQSTSIPGVAQRTGATTYYLEIHPRPDAELGGRKPVFSLYPVPGALDLLVSSELLETVRQIGLGLASPERTTVISSSSRALTVAEKMQLADGRASEEQLLAMVQRYSREARVFDMAAMAQQTGTVISAVLLGAVAASGLLPFAREAYEAVIRASGKGVDASLRGFGRAYDTVATARAQQAVVLQAAQAATAGIAPSSTRTPTMRGCTSSGSPGCSRPNKRLTRRACRAGSSRARRHATSRCGWPSTTSCAWPTSSAAPAAIPACAAR
jgi:indolepyruvate ferredoxin oxidoreductase, beta subunit